MKGLDLRRTSQPNDHAHSIFYNLNLDLSVSWGPRWSYLQMIWRRNKYQNTALGCQSSVAASPPALCECLLNKLKHEFLVAHVCMTLGSKLSYLPHQKSVKFPCGEPVKFSEDLNVGWWNQNPKRSQRARGLWNEIYKMKLGVRYFKRKNSPQAVQDGRPSSLTIGSARPFSHISLTPKPSGFSNR